MFGFFVEERDKRSAHVMFRLPCSSAALWFISPACERHCRLEAQQADTPGTRSLSCSIISCEDVYLWQTVADSKTTKKAPGRHFIMCYLSWRRPRRNQTHLGQMWIFLSDLPKWTSENLSYLGDFLLFVKCPAREKLRCFFTLHMFGWIIWFVMWAEASV